MRTIRVESLKNQSLIADKCSVAESYWQRLRGLIGQKELREGMGMWIPSCSSVHMWFMKIPLDIVFANPAGEVRGKEKLKITSLYSDVQPWKCLPINDFHAQHVIEFPAGTIKKHELEVGNELCISS